MLRVASSSCTRATRRPHRHCRCCRCRRGRHYHYHHCHCYYHCCCHPVCHLKMGGNQPTPIWPTQEWLMDRFRNFFVIHWSIFQTVISCFCFRKYSQLWLELFHQRIKFLFDESLKSVLLLKINTYQRGNRQFNHSKMIRQVWLSGIHNEISFYSRSSVFTLPA